MERKIYNSVWNEMSENQKGQNQEWAHQRHGWHKTHIRPNRIPSHQVVCTTDENGPEPTSSSDIHKPAIWFQSKGDAEEMAGAWKASNNHWATSAWQKLPTLKMPSHFPKTLERNKRQIKVSKYTTNSINLPIESIHKIKPQTSVDIKI